MVKTEKYKGIIIEWTMTWNAKKFLDGYLSEYERKMLYKIYGDSGVVDFYWFNQIPDRFKEIKSISIEENGSQDLWTVQNYHSGACRFLIEATASCSTKSREQDSQLGMDSRPVGSSCLHYEGKTCYSFKIKTIDESKRVISNRDRYEVLNRQHWKCNICGCRLMFSEKNGFEGCKVAHMDHIHPFSKRETYNGRDINEISNLQALCPDCNTKKSKKEIQ